MEYEDILTILKRDHIVTDIKVKKCSKYTSCKLSKVEQVQEWKKIDTPLELYANSFQFQNFVKSISIFQHYIYVVELPIDKMERGLVDVRITSSETPPPSDEGEGEWVYEQVGSSLNLWKKFQFKEEGASIVNTEFIRSIEVLYGMDDLTDGRDNWNMQEEPIPIMDYENIIPPHLSLLKVSMKRQPEIIAEHERFQSAKNQQLILAEGRFFKMLQLSDLHFGPGKGNCHGNVEVCEADAKTLEFIESSINKEEARPVKLVIITGDLIDSFQTKDFRSTILKGLSIILQKKIPFIFTFGELDEIAAVLESEELKLERDGKKPQDKDRNIDPVLKLNILNFISTLPRCYNTAQKYDKNIHGLTNYNLRVFHLKDTNNEKDLQLDKPEVVISVLDSENHKIQASQINHLNRFNKGIKTQDPFKLLFFHYPLPNYRPSGGFNIIGSYNQKVH